jgi:hypothetical protein
MQSVWRGICCLWRLTSPRRLRAAVQHHASRTPIYQIGEVARSEGLFALGRLVDGREGIAPAGLCDGTPSWPVWAPSGLAQASVWRSSRLDVQFRTDRRSSLAITRAAGAPDGVFALSSDGLAHAVGRSRCWELSAASGRVSRPCIHRPHAQAARNFQKRNGYPQRTAGPRAVSTAAGEAARRQPAEP